MKKLIVLLKQRYKGIIKHILTNGKHIGRFRAVKKDGKWMIKPQKEAILYDAVNLDINNTCNLRCHFCFNKFDEEPCYMSEDVFQKILSLFPLVRPINKGGEGIFFSCIYEPTISPHFLEFLKLLPPDGRSKVFFTSNFCKSFTEEDFRTILSSNLHHINISVETFQQERYQEICSSIRFDSFYQNLEKLSAAYTKLHGHKPKLYYVTMILKINRDELVPIVKTCSEKLHAARHDLRTPYISASDNNVSWNLEQLMTADECSRIRQELESLHLPVILDIHSKEEINIMPPDTTESPAVPSETDNPPHTPLIVHMLDEIRLCMEKEFFFLRFHASGLCTFLATGETCMISEAEDTVSFYKKKLHALCKRRAKAFLCPKTISEAISYHSAKEIPMRVVFGKVTSNPVYLFLQGWIYPAMDLEEDIFIFLIDKKTQQAFLAFEQPCPDWMRNPTLPTYSFAVCIDHKAITGPLTNLEFLFVKKQDLKPLYCYHYPYGIIQ